MTAGFEPAHTGGVVVSLSGFEADLLRSLASQLVELLRNEVAAPSASEDPLEAMLDFSGPSNAPEDPVLARLFPTAYPDDEEAAGEFRRFTEGALRDGKARSAGQVIEQLEQAGLPDQVEEGVWVDVELDAPSAHTWMRSLTDVRLALAVRLEVTEADEDYWDSLPEDDPRSHVHDIYDWVGFLQETLVQSLDR